MLLEATRDRPYTTMRNLTIRVLTSTATMDAGDLGMGVAVAVAVGMASSVGPRC